MNLLLSNPPQIELDQLEVDQLDKSSRLLVASANKFQAELKQHLKNRPILNDRKLVELIIQCNRFYASIFDLLEMFTDWQYTLLSNSRPVDINDLPQPLTIEQVRQAWQIQKFVENMKSQSKEQCQ